MKTVTGLGIGVGLVGVMLTSAAWSDCWSSGGKGDGLVRPGRTEAHSARNGNGVDAYGDSDFSGLILDEGVALTGWVDSIRRPDGRSCVPEDQSDKNNQYMIGLKLAW
ncbi:MAG: hypothetical protein G8237_07895 [Magnetococcales bacterium]|nr:hypothetical protein [Magnetococcales bacterium]NGZ06264.1 hypothetical protein [Magnetococcales bacterium]